MAEPPDISIIICTRNRAQSLTRTLDDLARTLRRGTYTDVIVSDNGSTDATREVARSFASRLPIRYCFEPTQGTYGKSHALNRALDEGGLGRVVAVLDDDMSPHPDWLSGVEAICRRWPNKDIFSGKSYVIWPEGPIPKWAMSSRIRSWAFSVLDWGDQDRTLPHGMWFSGNHFWFRSRALENRRRFRDIWLTEPDFMLQLAEDGHEGVYGPDAVVGHRIQPELFREDVLRARARKVGHDFAQLRLDPRFTHLRHVRLFTDHPVAARLFCALQLARWTSAYHLGSALRHDRALVAQLCALERQCAFRSFLQAAHEHSQYHCWRKHKAWMRQ